MCASHSLDSVFRPRPFRAVPCPAQIVRGCFSHSARFIWLGVRLKVLAMLAVIFVCVLVVPGCRCFALQCSRRTLCGFAYGFNSALSKSALVVVPPLPRYRSVAASCGVGFFEVVF